MKRRVIESGGLVEGRFPLPEEIRMMPHNYWNWVIRYSCERADEQLLNVLDHYDLNRGRSLPIRCSHIITVPTSRKSRLGSVPHSFPSRAIVATNIFVTAAPKLAPDGRHLAYLMCTRQYKEENSLEEPSLFVAALKGDVDAMLVDHSVAIGYDWRHDSKSLLYLDADQKYGREAVRPGMLKETVVADEEGLLLAKPNGVSDLAAIQTHSCASASEDMAYVLFCPWLKAEYGSSGNIFFSSPLISLPSSKSGIDNWSLFCYDPVTKNVSNILSSETSRCIGPAVSGFSLSGDGEKVLLPMEKNRFLIYHLGTFSGEEPVRKEEVFGQSLKLAPSWKKDEVACLVSERSPFLSSLGEQRSLRKEVVILGPNNKIRWILSKDWPNVLVEAIDSEGPRINSVLLHMLR